MKYAFTLNDLRTLEAFSFELHLDMDPSSSARQSLHWAPKGDRAIHKPECFSELCQTFPVEMLTLPV